jgi:hypothetical protein
MSNQETNSNNFVLKDLTSILTGGYILAGTYAIKYVLDTFLVDDTTLETVSFKAIQLLILLLSLLVLIAASLTIYFKAKKTSKKLDNMLWNVNTKTVFKKFSIGVLVIIFTLFFLVKLAFFNYLAPVFLLFYGVLLFFLKNKNRKDFLILSFLSIVLGVLCFLIPTYWYSSLSILGIAHITYGVVVKN